MVCVLVLGELGRLSVRRPDAGCQHCMATWQWPILAMPLGFLNLPQNCTNSTTVAIISSSCEFSTDGVARCFNLVCFRLVWCGGLLLWVEFHIPALIVRCNYFRIQGVWRVWIFFRRDEEIWHIVHCVVFFFGLVLFFFLVLSRYRQGVDKAGDKVTQTLQLGFWVVEDPIPK